MTFDGELITIHERPPSYKEKKKLSSYSQLKPPLTSYKHDSFLSYLASSLSALCSFFSIFSFQFCLFIYLFFIFGHISSYLPKKPNILTHRTWMVRSYLNFPTLFQTMHEINISSCHLCCWL